jgi:hypothetical protein
MDAVLITHAVATLFMVGLIWFVQVVHYPLFRQVGGDLFPAYARLHAKRTSWVVGPPMLLEMTTALLLLWLRPPGVPLWMLWAGLLLLVVIWLSTWLLQVPQHAILAEGFNAQAQRRLVRTNWIRTMGWSLRGALAVWVLMSAHAHGA